MIRQQLKDIYFALNRWAVLPNTWLARARFRNPPDPEGWYLNLGSGGNPRPGMVNIDGNLAVRSNLWLDLRNKLPFATASARFIYCSHTIEHLYPDEALRLLREIRRVLHPGQGVVRLCVPSFEHALAIAAGNATMRYPRPFDDPHAQALNYLFCDGQHKFGYCQALLEQFCRDAGFEHLLPYSQRHGVAPAAYGKITVGDEPEGTLIIELSAHPRG